MPDMCRSFDRWVALLQGCFTALIFDEAALGNMASSVQSERLYSKYGFPVRIMMAGIMLKNYQC
jgi:hypothetical protein